jgi:hypothetical protein
MKLASLVDPHPSFFPAACLDIFEIKLDTFLLGRPSDTVDPRTHPILAATVDELAVSCGYQSLQKLAPIIDVDKRSVRRRKSHSEPFNVLNFANVRNFWVVYTKTFDSFLIRTDKVQIIPVATSMDGTYLAPGLEFDLYHDVLVGTCPPMSYDDALEATDTPEKLETFLQTVDLVDSAIAFTVSALNGTLTLPVYVHYASGKMNHESVRTLRNSFIRQLECCMQCFDAGSISECRRAKCKCGFDCTCPCEPCAAAEIVCCRLGDVLHVTDCESAQYKLICMETFPPDGLDECELAEKAAEEARAAEKASAAPRASASEVEPPAPFFLDGDDEAVEPMETGDHGNVAPLSGDESLDGEWRGLCLNDILHDCKNARNSFERNIGLVDGFLINISMLLTLMDDPTATPISPARRTDCKPSDRHNHQILKRVIASGPTVHQGYLIFTAAPTTYSYGEPVKPEWSAIISLASGPMGYDIILDSAGQLFMFFRGTKKPIKLGPVPAVDPVSIALLPHYRLLAVTRSGSFFRSSRASPPRSDSSGSRVPNLLGMLPLEANLSFGSCISLHVLYNQNAGFLLTTTDLVSFSIEAADEIILKQCALPPIISSPYTAFDVLDGAAGITQFAISCQSGVFLLTSSAKDSYISARQLCEPQMKLLRFTENGNLFGVPLAGAPILQCLFGDVVALPAHRESATSLASLRDGTWAWSRTYCPGALSSVCNTLVFGDDRCLRIVTKGEALADFLKTIDTFYDAGGNSDKTLTIDAMHPMLLTVLAYVNKQDVMRYASVLRYGTRKIAAIQSTAGSLTSVFRKTVRMLCQNIGKLLDATTTPGKPLYGLVIAALSLQEHWVELVFARTSEFFDCAPTPLEFAQVFPAVVKSWTLNVVRKIPVTTRAASEQFYPQHSVGENVQRHSIDESTLLFSKKAEKKLSKAEINANKEKRAVLKIRVCGRAKVGRLRAKVCRAPIGVRVPKSYFIFRQPFGDHSKKKKSKSNPTNKQPAKKPAGVRAARAPRSLTRVLFKPHTEVAVVAEPGNPLGDVFWLATLRCQVSYTKAGYLTPRQVEVRWLEYDVGSGEYVPGAIDTIPSTSLICETMGQRGEELQTHVESALPEVEREPDNKSDAADDEDNNDDDDDDGDDAEETNAYKKVFPTGAIQRAERHRQKLQRAQKHESHADSEADDDDDDDDDDEDQ